MAIKEQDKVFYEELANGDKVINLPITRANNVEGLGRSANTAYGVGDVVCVDNNKKVALKSITAGTTSNIEIDISTKNIGDTVTDGTVVWQVCNRTSDVTSVNGKTGDVVVDVPVQSVNGKTGDVTIAETPYISSATSIGGASPTTPAVVVASYRSGNSWYRKYSDGWIEQGGFIPYPTTAPVTITFPIAFTTAVLDCSTGYRNGAVNYQNNALCLTSLTGGKIYWSNDTKTPDGLGGNGAWWKVCGY